MIPLGVKMTPWIFVEDAMEIVLGSLWVRSESVWVVMGLLRIVAHHHRIVSDLFEFFYGLLGIAKNGYGVLGYC